MGSLPAYVDRDLLQSWAAKMKAPQDKLLQGLIDALPNTSPCLVNEPVKQKLAQVVRHHYQSSPEAIGMQAAGHSIPPTVKNHS
jgi:coproporphyrinogen III oxidase